MSIQEFVDPPWDAPLDVPTALSYIDDSATIAGMFFDAILQAARQAGASLGTARERYTRFRFYPQREFAELLVEAASIFYPGLPLRVALRKLGHSAPRAMIGSTVGKVILGSVEGVQEVITAMAKSYPINARPSRVEVVDASSEGVIVHLENVCYFLDSHHVGVFEGTMTYAGVRGTVKVRMQSPTVGDFLCVW